ncbi:hypothetical protein SLEP1_g13633 [Rubroshorea leprosula]|nr:hypothetical protein SLEP1_g13633 [Rubroshorea leprosula]
MLSCVWFSHPLSWEQWIGAVIVFGSLYMKNFTKTATQRPPPSEQTQTRASSPVNGIP